jgi:hypothetical protein
MFGCFASPSFVEEYRYGSSQSRASPGQPPWDRFDDFLAILCKTAECKGWGDKSAEAFFSSLAISLSRGQKDGDFILYQD